MAVLSLAFLAFLGGAFVMEHKVWPYWWLHSAYRAGVAAIEQETAYRNPYETNVWRQARRAERGVVVHDPERTYDGLTLYTSGHAQKVFLVAMDGAVVHEWSLPFSRVWDASAEVRDPRSDEFMFIFGAYAFPNGDLLALYDGIGDTPWGYGLVKMDRDSRVIWKYLARTHHDLDIAADGRIYVLTHQIRWNWLPRSGHLEPPRIDDFVAVLSPEGEELKRVSVIDAFVNSPYAPLLQTVPMNPLGDFLHTNAIELIDEAKARALPFASPGQVMISLRQTATIAVLDLEREEIVWAFRGPWGAQHDPDILPDGRILLFDNMGRVGPGGRSRVVELDPVTRAETWVYEGDARHPFDSEIRSNQQRLPNGNTLITESDGGRIFEVTPQKEIVWEFLNPVRAGEDDELIPVVSSGTRIGWEEFDPAFVRR